MHTIKITPNLLFEYQCTSGRFIRLPNRIEKIDSVARIESIRNFFARIGMLYPVLPARVARRSWAFLGRNRTFPRKTFARQSERNDSCTVKRRNIVRELVQTSKEIRS